MGQVGRKTCKLTSARQKDLDRDILQQISSGKYCPDFGEVPFSMQMIAVFEHL